PTVRSRWCLVAAPASFRGGIKLPSGLPDARDSHFPKAQASPKADLWGGLLPGRVFGNTAMKTKTEFEKFREATAKILITPKAEVDRRSKAMKKDPKSGRYLEPKKG